MGRRAANEPTAPAGVPSGLPAGSPATIGPDEALRLVVQEAQQLAPRTVPLVQACGLVLAELVAADRDHPPFPRATMDGYAVRTADAGKTVAVAGEVAAGQEPSIPVAEGSCVEIMTGAPCPPGTEAVVEKEQVRREGNRAILPAGIALGRHIAPQGSECPAGRTVLRPGTTVTPLAIAVMASFGLEEVRVVPRPTLGIITTGGELARPGGELRLGQIRDSNGPMLAAMACDLGLDLPPHLHAEDRLESILAALEQVRQRDIVLLTGGVSVGTYDLVPKALTQYGAEVVFHRVRQKPGKPLLFARKRGQLVFGLPGNPLACHFCFHRYVAGAVRQMEGKVPVSDRFPGQLTAPVEPKGSRTYFITARAEHSGGAGGAWLVHPLPGVTSADVFASSQANCYVEVPPGAREIPAGQTVALTWIGRVPWSS